MGDRYFDLANFSAHHELTDDQIRFFLSAYFGRADPRSFAQLKLLQAMSDFPRSHVGRLAARHFRPDLIFAPMPPNF